MKPAVCGGGYDKHSWFSTTFTILWKDIDGSEVFAYFVTTCDYNRLDGDRITFSGKNNTTTYR